jgi:cytochrome c-type biogenesis protein CcmH
MMRQFLLKVILLLFLQPVTHAEALYPFSKPTQQAQFYHLLRDLRCLVCQNQDLVDSNAELARDLREEVYRLVQEGKSDDDVMHYLTVRYGDFILFKPPVKSITFLLWGAPLLFLSIGLLIFRRTTRHE